MHASRSVLGNLGEQGTTPRPVARAVSVLGMSLTEVAGVLRPLVCVHLKSPARALRGHKALLDTHSGSRYVDDSLSLAAGRGGWKAFAVTSWLVTVRLPRSIIALALLSQRGQGAPAREPVLSSEEQKQLMLYYHRRQEELKVALSCWRVLIARPPQPQPGAGGAASGSERWSGSAGGGRLAGESFFSLCEQNTLLKPS